MAEIVRIGVFYDGSFFAHISDHYRYHHRRSARISFAGLHEFIRQEVASHEKSTKDLCHIVEAHYFRGRFGAEEAEKHDALLRERRFEDVLIRAGITPHFLLMPPPRIGDDQPGTVPAREKGIDVWLALEAYELALRKQLSVVVLVTGDADFLQLVRKLTAIGTRTMLTAWDLLSSVDGSRTRTAQVLIEAVTYKVMMHEQIDGRASKTDFNIENLFMPLGPADPDHEAEPILGSVPQRIVDDVASRETRDSARPAPSAVHADFAVGLIANVIYDKGFGFIRPEAGAENLFFHATDVEGCEFAELQSGECVRFVVAPNPKDGRPAARRVSRTP